VQKKRRELEKQHSRSRQQAFNKDSEGKAAYKKRHSATTTEPPTKLQSVAMFERLVFLGYAITRPKQRSRTELDC
jgi:hypothetical protein